jgi:hypothetical protein
MRRKKPPPTRNKLNLADPRQTRRVRKRLKLSEAELTNIVERAGDSISAIGKEAALQLARQAARRRVTQLPQSVQMPSAATIVSGAEQASASELPAPDE